MSAKLDEKRLKLAAQGLRKTAISLQAAVVSLLQAAEALTAETDHHLVEHNPPDVNLQDLLKGDINGTIGKLLNDVLNNESALYEDQRTQNGKQAANGVKKSRKPRPPRDPDAPIRPQNAYIFFQKDVANQVKEENKGKPWSEIVHLISTRWKALPKEDREIYEHRFKEAKQNYEIEYKAYMQKKGQEVVADADGADSHENNITDSATPNSTSTTSHSEDENEEEEEDTPNLSNVRSSRSKAKSAKIAQPDPESSSKKKSKKRRLHDEDDDEITHEEEYGSPKKSKKKILNEEGSDVQGKERKKFKKISREEEDVEVGKSRKKRSKKKKQE